MFLLARTDMSPAEPERTVDKWHRDLSARYGRSGAADTPSGRCNGGTVAKGSGFLALLLGAAAAGCGGVIGAPRRAVVTPLKEVRRGTPRIYV